jgi:hypothetical protein
MSAFGSRADIFSRPCLPAIDVDTPERARIAIRGINVVGISAVTAPKEAFVITIRVEDPTMSAVIVARPSGDVAVVNIAAANCSPYVGFRRTGGEHKQREDAKDRFHVSLLWFGVPEFTTQATRMIRFSISKKTGP